MTEPPDVKAARSQLINLAVEVSAFAAALCILAALADWLITRPGSSWQYEVFGALGASVVTSLVWCTVVARGVRRLTDRIAAKVAAARMEKNR